MRKIILQCGVVLLALNFIIWWLIFYSPANIPISVPVFPDSNTPLNIYGLVVIVVSDVVLWLFIRRYLRFQPETTLIELSSISILSTLFAECVFQLVREPTHTDDSPIDHVRHYLIATIVSSVVIGLIGIRIAGRLKKNRAVPWIVTALFFLVGYLYGEYFAS